jgi:hypothetical protein
MKIVYLAAATILLATPVKGAEVNAVTLTPMINADRSK